MPHLVPARSWLVVAGVWVIYASFGATAASLAPLLPEVRSGLKIGNAMLGLILGAWPLTYLFAAIPCGILLDRIGPSIGLLLSCGFIALSGFARAIANDELSLLMAVALFGLGGPLISVGAPKLIAEMFKGPARATAMGIYITGPSVGAIAALSLTTPVLLPLGGDWRGVMVLHGVVALAAAGFWLMVVVFAQLPAQQTTKREKSGQAIRLILQHPAARVVLFMAMGIFFLNHGLNNWLPDILRAKGMSSAQAGLWAALPTLFGLAAAVVVPRLAVPARRVFVLAIVVCSSILGSALLLLPPSAGLVGGLLMLGLAKGALNTIALLILLESPVVSPERIGTAGGLFFTAAEIGGLLGPLTFGVMRQATGGFIAPILSLCVVSIVLLVLCASLRRLS